MGTQTGKEAIKKIRAFNENIGTPERMKEWTAVFNALDHGLLRSLHFDTLERLLKESAPPTALLTYFDYPKGPRVTNKTRKLNAVFLSAAAYTDHPDIFMPQGIALSAMPRIILSASRTLPTILQTEHIETQFLDRVSQFQPNPPSRNPFDYQRHKGVIIIGTVMAIASSAVYTPDSIVKPAFIPAEYGAYLGVIIKNNDPLSFLPATYNSKFRNDDGTIGGCNFVIDQFKDDPVSAHECVSSESDTFHHVFLKTYIHQDQFKSEQRELAALLEPLVQMAAQDDFAREFYLQYTLGILDFNSPHIGKQYHDLYTRLRDIMAGPVWQKMAKQAQKSVDDHLVRRERSNPRLMLA